MDIPTFNQTMGNIREYVHMILSIPHNNVIDPNKFYVMHRIGRTHNLTLECTRGIKEGWARETRTWYQLNFLKSSIPFHHQ